jgi:hypothetical protein
MKLGARKRMWWTGAIAVAFLIGAQGAGADPTADGTSTMTVSPETVTRGSQLTVTGDGCIYEGTAGLMHVRIEDSEGAPQLPPVSPDGRWTAKLTVPGGISEGRHEMLAFCSFDDDEDTIVTSTSFFVIVPGETKAVSVNPNKVNAGGSVTASGSGCFAFDEPEGQSEGQPATVSIFDDFTAPISAVPPNRPPTQPVAVVDANADGTWGPVKIPVPPGTPAGSHLVGAQCAGRIHSADVVTVVYIPAVVTVTAPAPAAPPAAPAVPVSAKPKFTG